MFDPSKPVKTRKGHSARIIYTEAAKPYPIVALIRYRNGVEEPRGFTKDGMFMDGKDNSIYADFDLVNVPEPTTFWVVFDGNEDKLYRFRYKAEASRFRNKNKLYRSIPNKVEVKYDL